MRAISVWFPIVRDESPRRNCREVVERLIGFGTKKTPSVLVGEGLDSTRAVEFVHVIDPHDEVPWLPEWEGGYADLPHVTIDEFNALVAGRAK